MKNFLTIAVVAVLLMSLGVSSDEQDDNTDLKFIEGSIKDLHTAMEGTEAIVRKALSEIPSDAAYDEHRAKLNKYLQESENYTPTKAYCKGDSEKYTEIYVRFLMSYMEPHTEDSAETQEITKVLTKLGLPELRESYLSSPYEKYGWTSVNIYKNQEAYYAKHC